MCAYGMHVCLSLGFCICVFVVLFPLSCFVGVVAVPVRIFKGVQFVIFLVYFLLVCFLTMLRFSTSTVATTDVDLSVAI